MIYYSGQALCCGKACPLYAAARCGCLLLSVYLVGNGELLATSDIVSIHAPLNAQTEGLMDAAAFKQMKKTAVLINVGRGPIIVEKDLAEALKSGTIAAAGLDVLTAEPMSKESPFCGLKDGRLFITPHIAWASVEARTRLMDIIAEQIREFYHKECV